MSKIISLNYAIGILCRAVAAVHPTNITLAWTIYRIPAFFLQQRQGGQAALAYPITVALLEHWFGDERVHRALTKHWPGEDVVSRDTRLVLEDIFKRLLLHIEHILDKVGHGEKWPHLVDNSVEAMEVARLLLAYEDMYLVVLSQGPVPDADSWLDMTIHKTEVLSDI